MVRDADQLDRAAGWTVIAGEIDKLPDVNKKKLLLIGACTAKFKKEGIFVNGCPPHNRDICRGFHHTGIDILVGLDVDSIDAMGEV